MVSFSTSIFSSAGSCCCKRCLYYFTEFIWILEHKCVSCSIYLHKPCSFNVSLRICIIFYMIYIFSYHITNKHPYIIHLRHKNTISKYIKDKDNFMPIILFFSLLIEVKLRHGNLLRRDALYMNGGGC